MAPLALDSEDVVDHTPLVLGQAPGRAGLRQAIGGLLAAFPDCTVTVVEVVVEADTVMVRNLGRSTHHGVFVGIPPSRQSIEIAAIEVWPVAEGRLTESGLLTSFVLIRRPSSDPS